jgi:hypothetical protein
VGSRTEFCLPNEDNEIQDQDTPIEEVDDAILQALADEPFSLVRKLACHTCLSRMMVHRYLTISSGFTIRYLRWVLHLLSDDQKRSRIDLSR